MDAVQGVIQDVMQGVIFWAMGRQSLLPRPIDPARNPPAAA
jgi:hypothetical protein